MTRNTIRPVTVKDRMSFTSDEWITFALNLCRGRYQRSIVDGFSLLSGSDLKGKARKFYSKYKHSAEAVLRRMSKAGIPWYERRRSNGKRELIIGEVK